MLKVFGGWLSYLEVPLDILEKHQLVYLSRLDAEKTQQEEVERQQRLQALTAP